MKKVIFALVAMVALSFNSFAEENEYVLNDNAIENAFNAATEVSLQDINLFAENGIALTANSQSGSAMMSRSSVNPWAAFAICTFLGGFGIHRHYMGTSKWMWAYYTFTCGGLFGIVTFVDWIVLLVGAIQDDIGSYTGNTRFFMWM